MSPPSDPIHKTTTTTTVDNNNHNQNNNNKRQRHQRHRSLAIANRTLLREARRVCTRMASSAIQQVREEAPIANRKRDTGKVNQWQGVGHKKIGQWHQARMGVYPVSVYTDDVSVDRLLFSLSLSRVFAGGTMVFNSTLACIHGSVVAMVCPNTPQL